MLLKQYLKTWPAAVVIVFGFLALILWLSESFKNNPESDITDNVDMTRIITLPVGETLPVTIQTFDITEKKSKNISKKLTDPGEFLLHHSKMKKYNPFNDLLVELTSTDDPRLRQMILGQTLVRLKSLPPDEASSIIVSFLDSKQNFDIGMPFRVGAGGNLRSHPTLRVAALDWLGQICPDHAFSYAEETFSASEDPDEWAVSLRNYGRQIAPQGDERFNRLVAEMVTRRDWQSEPSDGFIEAFDMVVFNKQYSLLEELLNIIQSGADLGVISAAVIEAMVQHDRENFFRFVHSNNGFPADLPRLRAFLMARADIRSSFQRQVIENYLLDNDISLREKKRFIHDFPNFSRFLGHRLLTRDHVFPLAVRAEIDVAALEAVNDWLDNECYLSMAPALMELKDRLEKYVVSAKRGGLIPIQDQ